MNKGQPYTNKTDLWSIGVVFYQMLFGKLPFPAGNLEELKTKVKFHSGQNLRIPFGSEISPMAEDLLKRMLEVDVDKRITWNEFFHHEIFTNIKNSSYIPEIS